MFVFSLKVPDGLKFEVQQQIAFRSGNGKNVRQVFMKISNLYFCLGQKENTMCIFLDFSNTKEKRASEVHI